MRWLLAPLVALALGAAPASAAEHITRLESWDARVPSQTLTVIDQTSHGVDPGLLASYEQQITKASIGLRRWWHTPIVRWGRGGWPVYLVDGLGRGESGYHDFSTHPYAYVSMSDSLSMSHEIFEMLVDPQANGIEVCDPVSNAEAVSTARMSTGAFTQVVISDYVTPAWFRPHASGPFDAFGYVKRAGQELS